MEAGCSCVCPITSDSLWPDGLQPARLLCPWKFPRQEYWSGLPFPSLCPLGGGYGRGRVILAVGLGVLRPEIMPCALCCPYKSPPALGLSFLLNSIAVGGPEVGSPPSLSDYGHPLNRGSGAGPQVSRLPPWVHPQGLGFQVQDTAWAGMVRMVGCTTNVGADSPTISLGTWPVTSSLDSR